jgi:hypothetical protein
MSKWLVLICEGLCALLKMNLFRLLVYPKLDKELVMFIF